MITLVFKKLTGYPDELKLKCLEYRYLHCSKNGQVHVASSTHKYYDNQDSAYEEHNHQL
jgi:hypothetical protein